jgi:hypothetical protein
MHCLTLQEHERIHSMGIIQNRAGPPHPPSPGGELPPTNIPTVEQAKVFLEDARIMYPGPWVERSLVSAAASERIAKHYPVCIEYSLYDKLVQLCDYLSLPSGFFPVEKG